MLGSIVNTLGLGSGLDVPALIRDLAAASRVPKVQAIEAKARTAQARISAVAQARSDLDSFAASLAGVVAGGTLRTQRTVSDPNAITATAIAGGKSSNATAEIEIMALARSQSLVSATIASSAAPVGQGTLTLSVNGRAQLIVIDATNDSLSGLASAINASGSGVTASIVTDPDGNRLVLKGASGSANSFTLTGQTGNDNALDRFTFAGAGSPMTLAQAAQNASFTVDGIPYSRDTNSVSDVIAGVTVTLKKAAPGALITIGGDRPTAAIRTTISDFVSVFNQLKGDVVAARTTTGGDQSLRSLEEKLLRFISAPLTSDPSINSLSDIGISTSRSGTISLDPSKLEAALLSNPDAVEALFSPLRDAAHTEASDPGLSGAFSALVTSLTAENGALSSLGNRLTREASLIAKNRERLDAREAAYEARLQRQFGNVDARVGALRATQSYLEQQIAVWTKGN